MRDQAPDISARRALYPDTHPHATGRLRVSDVHELHYEECGNPKGKPVVMLHGGPGGGISPTMRRFHDPAAYRIVLFDQRGAGKSTPAAELEDNTTWHLVADIEALRRHLGVESWQVFGGSWGSTLALAYAETHPERVSELVLRGIFLGRRSEIDWLYKEGCNWLFPDAWEAFTAPIPEDERSDFIAAYSKRLVVADGPERLVCAKAWSQWEGTTVSLLPNPERVASFGADAFAITFARIECHYFAHRCFFAQDGELLEKAHRLRGIPGVIVHGRYDVVTPLANAWALHQRWPEADLEIVADAGHTMTEPGLIDALVRATDRFRDAKTA
jgi:proline iminopeptidase